MINKTSIARMLDAIISFTENRNIQLADFTALHQSIDSFLERRKIGAHVRMIMDLLWTDENARTLSFKYTGFYEFTDNALEHIERNDVEFKAMDFKTLQEVTIGYIIHAYFTQSMDKSELIRGFAPDMSLMGALKNYFEDLLEITQDNDFNDAKKDYLIQELEEEYYYSHKFEVEDKLQEFINLNDKGYNYGGCYA